ncbi:DUF3970 family protein [Bacillus cereus]|uniref:DUF3970 domain-containing protein n=1 Tax=Bacillus cereus TaxID=1396 RepID=A0A161TQ05_BACCE|nr:DUF3970 family protein [Bacillus cereus]KZD56296.1 hypothetical protein B4088_5145 [Bacillus cereus]
MIKIRLQGLSQEMQEMIEDLKKHYDILSISDFYKNRNSQYIRCYVEIRLKS